MAGFQTMNMPRPSFGHIRPQTPVVNINLVRPVREEPVVINPKTGLARITPSLIRQMRKMRADGSSQHEIAAALKTSRSSVKFHTQDVPPPPGGWKTGGHKSKIKLDKAQRMKRAGFTNQEIAEEFGLTSASAWRALNSHCRKRRAPGGGQKKPLGVIAWKVARIAGLKVATLYRDPAAEKSKGDANVAKARHIAFWLLHRRCGFSLLEVSNSLGGFNHSSVIYGVRRVEAAIREAGVKVETYPLRAARRLWEADWSARKAA